jgi:hypothetical protein
MNSFCPAVGSKGLKESGQGDQSTESRFSGAFE